MKEVRHDMFIIKYIKNMKVIDIINELERLVTNKYIEYKKLNGEYDVIMYGILGDAENKLIYIDIKISINIVKIPVYIKRLNFVKNLQNLIY